MIVMLMVMIRMMMMLFMRRISVASTLNRFSELCCDEGLGEERREVAARRLQQVGQRQHQLCLREED